MTRPKAAALFLAVSLLLPAGAVLSLVHCFPAFFAGARGEALALGAVIGWGTMWLTFALFLWTVERGHNAFMGGYVAGFLVRLAALGGTALGVELTGLHPLAFVLTSLVGTFFLLFLAEAWILSRLPGLALAMPAGVGGGQSA